MLSFVNSVLERVWIRILEASVSNPLNRTRALNILNHSSARNSDLWTRACLAACLSWNSRTLELL